MVFLNKLLAFTAYRQLSSNKSQPDHKNNVLEECVMLYNKIKAKHSIFLLSLLQYYYGHKPHGKEKETRWRKVPEEFWKSQNLDQHGTNCHLHNQDNLIGSPI